MGTLPSWCWDSFCLEDTGEAQRRKGLLAWKEGADPARRSRGEGSGGERDFGFLGRFQAPSDRQEPGALTAAAVKRARAACGPSPGGAVSTLLGGAGGYRRTQPAGSCNCRERRHQWGLLGHPGAEFRNGNPRSMRDPEAKLFFLAGGKGGARVLASGVGAEPQARASREPQSPGLRDHRCFPGRFSVQKIGS